MTSLERRFDFLERAEEEQTFYAVIILLDSFLFILFFQLFACPSFRSRLQYSFFLLTQFSDEKEDEKKKVSISLQSKVLPHYKSLFRLFNYISQNELR